MINFLDRAHVAKKGFRIESVSADVSSGFEESVRDFCCGRIVGEVQARARRRSYEEFLRRRAERLNQDHAGWQSRTLRRPNIDSETLAERLRGAGEE